MDNSDPPRKLPFPFGASAGASFRRVVPFDSQIGIVDGAASYEDGFPPLNATPTGSGGVPPSIKDMNGLEYDATHWGVSLSAGRMFYLYDSAYSTLIGGYPAGAILASTTQGSYWRSTVNNNTTDPDSDGAANWAPFFPDALARATAADVTAGTATGKYIDPVALRGASPFTVTGGSYVLQHPNGWIEMGGVDPTSRSGEVAVTVTFPATFPNACLGIRGTVRNTGQSTIGCTQVQEVSISATGAVVFLQSDVHPYSDAAGGFRWQAWGY